MNFGNNAYRGGDRVIVRRRIEENKLAAIQSAVQKNYHLGSIAKWEQSSAKLMNHKAEERQNEELAKQRKLDLEIRRSKLRQLLEMDAVIYKKEIDSKMETPAQRRARLEKQAKELRAKRIARREEFVAKQRLKQFREQCDELRLNNGRNLTMECDRIRKQQMKEKELAKEYEKGLDRHHLKIWQEELQKKIDRETRETEYKQNLNQSTAQGIRKQMAELEAQREKMKEFKLQETAERARKLQEAEQEKRLKEMEKSMTLKANREEIRQEYEEYQRRKKEEESKAAQEDYEFVQRVLAAEQADDAKKAEKHQGDKEQIQKYLAYLEGLKKREEENEKVLEALRLEQQEAQWAKREMTWKKEELARQQLLANVVDGRSDQIAYKKSLQSKGAAQNMADTKRLTEDFEKFKLEEKSKSEERLKHSKEIQAFLSKQIEEREQAKKDGHDDFMAFDVNAEKNAAEYERLLKQEKERDAKALAEGKSAHQYPRTTANWWTY